MLHQQISHKIYHNWFSQLHTRQSTYATWLVFIISLFIAVVVVVVFVVIVVVVVLRIFIRSALFVVVVVFAC